MTSYIIALVVVVPLIFAISYYVIKRGQQPEKSVDQEPYIEGLKALIGGNDEKAFTRLKEAAAQNTDNVNAYIHLGNIMRRMKKPQQALQIHRDLTYRHSLSSEEKKEILEALYDDFTELKDESSAERAVKEILEILPGDRRALLRRLRTLETSGEWKEAAIVRKKLDKIDGIDSTAILALYKVFEGDALHEQGDPHRARLHYKEALHIDKQCLPAFMAIGDSYYQENRHEDALNYWTKVISTSPSEGHIVFERLKKGFFEVGRYGEYADALATLLQSDPEHLTARLELAYFMERKGDTDTAREHYVTALDAHPDSMLARLGLYRLYRDTGNKESAENTFKQVMKMAVKKEAQNYRCRECGLESVEMRWLCPRCKAVNSFSSNVS